MESTSSTDSVEVKFRSGAELKSPPPNVVPDNSILRTSLQKRLQSTNRLEPIEKSKLANRRIQRKSKRRDYSPVVIEKQPEDEKLETSGNKLISIKRLVLPEKHRPLINVDISSDEDEFDSVFLSGPSVHQPFLVNKNAIDDDFGLDLTLQRAYDAEEEIDLTNGEIITEELELIPPDISVKEANKGCLSICNNFANYWCSAFNGQL